MPALICAPYAGIKKTLLSEWKQQSLSPGQETVRHGLAGQTVGQGMAGQTVRPPMAAIDGSLGQRPAARAPRAGSCLRGAGGSGGASGGLFGGL